MQYGYHIVCNKVIMLSNVHCIICSDLFQNSLVCFHLLKYMGHMFAVLCVNVIIIDPDISSFGSDMYTDRTCHL